MTKIVLENIYYKYKEKYIIEDFSYCFSAGNIYWLLGKNASGKTTLLKCISTLALPNEGNIIFNDRKLISYFDYKMYRSNVSLMINAEKSLIDVLTVKQNICFFMHMNKIKMKNVSEKLLEMINGFALSSCYNEQVKHLSKGTKQKLALIIALLKNANIFLLDEPFDGLDDEAVDFLKKLIIDYSANAIVIIASPIKINNIDAIDLIIKKEQGDIQCNS